MGKFRTYDPGQVWLLPPSVGDVLGADHLSFFVHAIVERLDLRAIEDSYSEEGQPGYHPRLLLKLWLYAYCLGITSSRRLEQRTREDLGFRYLAAESVPDFWTLNAFRRRHAKALNDLFTQVLEWAREQGWGRLGHVAVDSTRIAANASRDRIVTEEKLRSQRAALRRQIRQWQKQCNEELTQEAGGTQTETDTWHQKLEQIPRQLKRLRKAGLKKQSVTDPDSRFLRTRTGFELGYTADIAVNEDHLIVGQRITQNPTDTRSLEAMVEQVEQRCGETPGQVSADSGFYRNEEIEALTSSRRGCLCSGFQSGAGAQWGTFRRSDGRLHRPLRCPGQWDAGETAIGGRTSDLPKKSGIGGTGLRHLERTAPRAEVPAAGTGEGSRGILPDGTGL